MSSANITNAKPLTGEVQGRFYTTNPFTPVNGWQYITAPTLAVAMDASPSLNAVISSTQNSSQLSMNQATGLIYLPKTGRWSFNIITMYLANLGTSNNYELRLAVYSSPAWPAANSAAKTFGVSAGSPGALAGVAAAQLATSPLITVNEGGLSYTGLFPAGTYIAPLVYATVPASQQSGSTPLQFISGGFYLEVKLDYLVK